MWGLFLNKQGGFVGLWYIHFASSLRVLKEGKKGI
jgi:hypothetical protein